MAKLGFFYRAVRGLRWRAGRPTRPRAAAPARAAAARGSAPEGASWPPCAAAAGRQLQQAHARCSPQARGSPAARARVAAAFGRTQGLKRGVWKPVMKSDSLNRGLHVIACVCHAAFWAWGLVSLLAALICRHHIAGGGELSPVVFPCPRGLGSSWEGPNSSGRVQTARPRRNRGEFADKTGPAGSVPGGSLHGT